MEQHLKSHGWDIITIDIQWYEPLAHTDRLPPWRRAGNGRQWPLASGHQPFPDDRGDALL